MPSVAAVPVREDRDRSWVPLVERGCCCSLEGCCKVQAILVVAMSLLYGPTLLIEYLQPQPHTIRCPTRLDRERGVYEIPSPLDCEWERRGHAGNAKTAELVVKVLLQLIAFGSALLFLVGIQKRRHKLLLPYVRVLGVHMMFNAVDLLVKACVYNMWAEAVLIILPMGIGIPYYMWICAYSLYRKMKLESPLQPHIVAHLPPQFMQDATVLPPLPPGYGYAPPTTVAVAASAKPDDLPPPYHLVVAADAAAMEAAIGTAPPMAVVPGVVAPGPGAVAARPQQQQAPVTEPPKPLDPNMPSPV